MKTFESQTEREHKNAQPGLNGKSVATVQSKEYEARTKYPYLAEAPKTQDLGLPIQRKSDPLAGNSGVVQLTQDSAAKELFDSGIITVKKSVFKKAFNEKHEVTAKDLDDIQGKLNALRKSAPKKEKPVAVNMRDSSNWPTAGGMDEGDAKIVAGKLGWTEDVTQWTCQDKSHTPKGKVYTNGEGAYYGADNTGHVGWGFKVWEVNKGKELKYKGNVTWNGEEWVYRARGTK